MPTNPNELALEILKRLQGNLTRLESKVDRSNTRLIAVEDHLASLNVAHAAQNSAVVELQLRMERVERRLRFADPTIDPNVH